MTMAKIRNGKKWIEEITGKVATEYRRSIDKLRWRTGKGSQNGMYSLLLFIDKIQYVEIFSEDDLTDLPKTPNMKVKVERRLRDLMKTIKSESEKKKMP